jgi:hypothetical protein
MLHLFGVAATPRDLQCTNITVSGKLIEEAEVAVNADLNNIREWLV